MEMGVYVGYGFCMDDVVTSMAQVMMLAGQNHLIYDALCKHLIYVNEENALDMTSDFSGDIVYEALEDFRYKDFVEGVASVFAGVFQECEGIELRTVRNSDDDMVYVFYEPSYPWETPEAEKKLTLSSLREKFKKYLNILAQNFDDIEIDYQTAVVCD